MDPDVEEMAIYFGIDPKKEQDLLWIAKQAIDADESTPDEHFKGLVEQHRQATPPPTPLPPCPKMAPRHPDMVTRHLDMATRQPEYGSP